jgi:hypothetical protein
MNGSMLMKGTFSAWDMGPPTIVFFSRQSVGPAMTIHPDGRITLGDDAKPTEAAAECVNAMSHMIQNLIDYAVQAERNRIVSYAETLVGWDGIDYDALGEGIKQGKHLK